MLRSLNSILLICAVIGSATSRAADGYAADWKSLEGCPVPAWFEDAKFGIFIHWGAYSVIGYRKGGRGYAEHVPKLLYADPRHYYPWLEERFGAHPPEFGYKDIVARFKAERWDPEQWAKLFADAGAKYVVLTAEHHDGYALWDSDLTPWCATKVGPMRDLVGDLGKAVRARGMRYAPSYHRERHPGFFAEQVYAVDSEPRPDIAAEIERVPAAAGLYGPFAYDDEFIRDYAARWREIQRKYRPDFMWLDDIPIFYKEPSHPQTEKLRQACAAIIAGFLNDAASRGQPVYLNNKGTHPNWPVDLGCREKDNLQMNGIGTKWENPATLGTSYGYLRTEEEGDLYKSPTELIHLLCDVVSKNGNLLLNIGPKADGTIPAGMQRRLLEMGRWLAVNGEAIYGTRPWKIYGEGVRASTGRRHAIHSTGVRFTRSADRKHVYALLLECPETSARIDALRSEGIEAVEMLGTEAKLEWSTSSEGLTVTLPAAKPCSHAYVLRVRLE